MYTRIKHTLSAGGGAVGGGSADKAFYFPSRLGLRNLPQDEGRRGEWGAHFNYYIIHIKHLFIKTHLKQAAKRGCR